MDVYEKVYSKGEVSVDFSCPNIETQIIPFYKLNGDDDMISCGGEEIELSNFNSEAFKDC